jgi:hypothetical protein
MAAFSKTADKTYQIILTVREDNVLADVLAVDNTRPKRLIEDFLREEDVKTVKRKKQQLIDGYANASTSERDAVDAILLSP